MFSIPLSLDNTIATAKTMTTGRKNLPVFAMLWLLTFIIYLPAAKAGWVIDSAGWLYNIRHLSFWDYINNKQSGIPSLYQFTQFVTWILYKLFNAHPYPWHVLMVTMHAVNAFLFFFIIQKLFDDSGIQNSMRIALTGVVLYTVCPHLSEVIVWEASFHYLQGFMLILLILYSLQKYLHTGAKKYAWLAGILYFCSTYSLEIFYLTPWFCLAFALYYRYALGFDKAIFKKALWLFFVPQLIMFGMHVVVLLVVYNHFAHIAENVWQPFATYISKPPFYIFHILFFGRYFSPDTRKAVYDALRSTPGLFIFYSAFVVICYYLFRRFFTFTRKGQAGVLLFVCIMISQVILMPLAFSEMLLMFYDRYTYFMNAYIYMLLALLLSYITDKYFSAMLLAGYIFLNLWFTTKLNIYWKQSTYIDNRLLHDRPDPGNKTVILLDMPENMEGVAMIGAQATHEYEVMHDLFVDKKISNKIYDVASYNMVTKEDGAHIKVLNDSVITVTLNQWGTWWWYEGHGAHSYENEEFKVDMVDEGHWFNVTLKHPAANYLLLYQQGDQWKIADMNKKNEDQY